jgi:hypothetical protein
MLSPNRLESEKSCVHGSLLPFWDPGTRFFCSEADGFGAGTPLRACGATGGLAFSRRLSGSAQGSQSLVNQPKERLKRISRTEFDVDAPDADGQSSRNLKES